MTVKSAVGALLLGAVFSTVAGAQDISLDAFSPLAAKSTQHVDLNLDAALLQLAGQFLSRDDPQQSKVRELLAGLRGIYVRRYTFAETGDYSMTDVDRARAQLKSWSQIVSVHEAGENTGIYVKTDAGKIVGLVVLSAQPKELTLVDISGTITPEQLRDLSGKFGIPDLSGLAGKAKSKQNQQ